MRKMLSVLLLSSLAGTVALAQQTPATRPLTPAEQRQKEKVEREIQRERQIRAEWAQKQREYEARQAEKERQRQAKKAGKNVDVAEPPKAAPAVVTPTTVPTAPTVSQPVETTPAVVEPTRKEKREQRRREEQEAKAAKEAEEKRKKETKTKTVPAPATVTPTPTPVEVAHPESDEVTPALKVEKPEPKPVEIPAKTAKPERPARQKKARVRMVDSVQIITSEPVSIQPRREFLPKGHLFEPILLDPLEAQTYGSVLPGYWTEGKKYAGSIVPFAFGFAKPFYRRTTEAGRSEEWVLDLASFTQFEAYHDSTAGKARRRILNNDYKISIIYNLRRGDNTYRFRVYHLSSHLGDDYIFRNRITAPTPNSVNYELLDVTYSRTVNNWRLYGGAGIVLRKTDERKPLSAQLGAFYKRPSTKAARLVGGVDVKFWQQTDFRPGIHGGVGIELGRTQNNLTFLLEGYSGFRPYSQYEDQQTSWIGAGVYLNPF